MQENTNVFKIIGLRVLPECDKSLQKVLTTDVTYFLCNDYEDDGKGGVCLRSDAQPLSSTFFCIGDNYGGPYVNLSCVVGHNGDGKSSLVELIIRVLNNFAYLTGFLADHKNLKYIPGLYAKLFYLVNDSVCCINCLGNIIELIVDGGVTFSRDFEEVKIKTEKRTKRLYIQTHDVTNLFYTLVSNYSLYAYNSEEFKSETNSIKAEDSWITALFHKNDAYQTPIVLSPQRKKGIIDINRQYDLAIQRLGELFFDCRCGKYMITATEKAEGIVYSLEKESKLITRTIGEYMSDSTKGAENVILFQGGFKSHHLRRKYVLDLNKKTELQLNINFWEHIDRRFFESNLLDIALKNCNVILMATGKKGETNIQTDLYDYLKKLESKLHKRKGYSLAKSNIEEFWNNWGGELTFMQFQRIYLVFEVYTKWLEILGTEEFKPFNSQTMTERDHALWYLVYKTIRVIENYPDFIAGGLKDYEIPHFFFHDEVRKRNVQKWFNAIDKDVNKDKSHITIKLRQCLYFLKHHNTAKLLTEGNVETAEIKRVLTDTGFGRYLDCETYYNEIEDKNDVGSALPPPIFDFDFVISRDNDSQYYPLSRMSSGERQLLNSSSSVVYHLKNIARSKAQGIKIIYHNVNVILEEVELYFHPEYQRRFIKYLLEQIQNAHLPSDMAINMLFITHSPFILSDIPRQHVLFLKDGKMDRSMQEDTFGANIHTLLQNGFFLSSVPIGEFAKGKISEMFKTLNKSESLTQDELDNLSKLIPLVSEPLLRSQLMRLYSQRKNFENGDYMAKIEALEVRIRDLEKQLNGNN